MTYNRGTGMGVLEQPFEGIIPNLERRYRETPSDAMRKELEECMSTSPAPAVMGTGCRIWPGQSLWEDWGCRNSAASPW